MKAIIHITTDGERWDSIAWRYYRDVRQTPRLLACNPHLAARPSLPGGQRVVVPIIARDPVASDPSRLPPWRR